VEDTMAIDFIVNGTTTIRPDWGKWPRLWWRRR